MPVNHLLKQVEVFRSKRTRRDVRPAWLTEFIDSVAELFDPLTGVGRIGFDCRWADDRWAVVLFLGSTEQVGGKKDGESRHANFQFDLDGLRKLFDEVDWFRWSAFPEGVDCDGHKISSYLTVEGRIGENALRLQIDSLPPIQAGPGLRCYPDGRCDTV